MTSTRQPPPDATVDTRTPRGSWVSITDVFWIPFHLPLREPLHTARGTVYHRDGLVVGIAADNGIVGLGEASPHPSLGEAAVREATATLLRVAARLLDAAAPIEGGPAAVDSWLGKLPDPLPPALACALDTAACDVLARSRDVSLARFLGQQVQASVAVNAVVAAVSTPDAAHHAAVAREQGFRCVKLKVGMASTADEECRRVAAVRHALGPGIRLRLDANGAWAVEEAIRIIRALEAYELELVEQPVAPGNLRDMEAVQSAVRTPIAADEDVTSIANARRIIERGAARILVVKPMVVGGLRVSRAIAALAADRGCSAVVTTTIDGAIGRGAALHLAATLPPHGLACGLATEALLAYDLATGLPAVSQGQMAVPDGPGLGVEIGQLRFRRSARRRTDKRIAQTG